MNVSEMLFISINRVSCIFFFGRIDGDNCCNGYRWVQDKCIACEIGLYGTDCNTTCLYPTFGRDCQYLCDCNATNCDHVKGCVQNIGDYKINSTLQLISKTDTKERIGPSNLSEESTTHTNTSECDANKTPHKGINYLLYPIFGLTAVSLIIYMVYLYTRSLERRLVKTNTV
nr:multiple epidermal growth factor-like domains protein 11 [Crassostrea gigas]